MKKNNLDFRSVLISFLVLAFFILVSARQNTTTVRAAETINASDLLINKTVSDNNESRVIQNTAERGELLTYYLRVENKSTVPVVNFKLEDDYDQSYVEVISWETGGVYSNDKVIWEIGDLAPLSTVEKTMVVRVKNDIADQTIFKNYLRTQADNASLQQTEVTTKVTYTVQDNVALSLEKTVSDNDETNKDYTDSHKNEVLTYRLSYNVSGRGQARNVVLRDDYDQRYVRILSTDGGGDNGNEIVWQLGNLEAGYHTIRYVTVQIVNNFANSVEISNWAYLRADNATEVEDRVRTNIEGAVENQSAYLSIVKTVSDTDENNVRRNKANVGEEMTYKIKISNNSSLVARDVSLTDDYDQSKIIIISFTGNAGDNGDQLIFPIGNLEPGKTAERFLTVRVKQDLSGASIAINNNVKVTGSNTQTMADQTVTTVTARPELNVTKTVSDNDEFDRHTNTAEPLETLIYTLTLENTGLTTLDNIAVLDNYDERYLKILFSDGGTDDGHVIRFPVGSLKAGEQTTRIITAQINDLVKNGLKINNRATVTASNFGPDNDNVSTRIYIPGVEVTATSSSPIAPRTGASLLLPIFGGLSLGSFAGLSSFSYFKKRRKTQTGKSITTSSRFNPV